MKPRTSTPTGTASPEMSGSYDNLKPQRRVEEINPLLVTGSDSDNFYNLAWRAFRLGTYMPPVYKQILPLRKPLLCG